MEENKETNNPNEKVFSIYELTKIIEESFNKSERPKPFEDEGAYAEDDE